MGTSSLHRSIPAKWSFFSKEKENKRNKKGGGCSCFIHKQFAPVYPSKVVFLLKRKRKLNKIKKIKKEAAAHALFTSSLHRSIPAKWSFFSKEKENKTKKKKRGFFFQKKKKKKKKKK